MEDEIFDIVTDLIRDDISKDEAVSKLLSLFNVVGRSEQLCDYCKKPLENTLQDLKCMLIEDGYKEDNIVLRTLIKAQQQVKNLNIPAVIKSVCLHEWDEGHQNVSKCKKCGKYSA